MVQVNSMNHLDPIFMYFKESVLSKINELFFEDGMGYLGIKVDCVYWMLMI